MFKIVNSHCKIKNMNYKWFIGIDVSKSTLDCCIMFMDQKLFHKEIENTPKGVKDYLKLLKKEIPQFLIEDAIFCMEHTGIYNIHLLSVLHLKKANIWLESAIHIIKSIGLQRGKNDVVDAYRIAKFSYKNRDEVKLWEPKRGVINNLKALSSVRNRLINCKKQLSNVFKNKTHISKEELKIIKQCTLKSINYIEKDIVKTDEKIAEIIKNDERLNHLFNLITSVDGVGKVTAIEILVTTNEFKSITEAKKFACYSGVAPFEHSSGTSIRGRTKVSKMANKKTKKVLHMAALSSIAMKGELRDYYDRKVEEGKNKMLVLNAIRNKIVLRVFACVNNNRMYVKDYKYVS